MEICILKLGAIGDVVRTIPIIEAIKEKYPNSSVTWITKPMCREILEGNKNINEILTIPCEVNKEFDILYSVDIDETATQLSSKIKAKEKYGYYYMDGFPASFNPEAEYYLNTIFDDELKKSNRKTYQEMIFEALKLKYKKQKIKLFNNESARKFAHDFLEKNNLKGKRLLGINIGSSPRWPSKAWALEKLEEFVPEARKKGYEIVLIWGPEEQEAIENLSSRLKIKGIKVYKTDTRDSLKNFFALVDICDKVISADSLALHTSLALNKPTIGLFFCTPPHEIEGYGLLKKIVSPMLKDFFPEKMDQYDKDLVNSISVKEVLDALRD
ncbi:MAG: glycosyltransferase family 9 protein [Candidatus Pacearchaeota archaeon]